MYLVAGIYGNLMSPSISLSYRYYRIQFTDIVLVHSLSQQGGEGILPLLVFLTLKQLSSTETKFIISSSTMSVGMPDTTPILVNLYAFRRGFIKNKFAS